MTVSNFANDVVRYYKQHGIDGLKYSVQDLQRGLSSRFGMLSPPPANNVLDEDFDLLIVLDACRYDLMAGIGDEYEWAGDIRPYRAASSSQEWIIRTFMERRSSLPYVLYDIWRDQTDPDLYAKHFDTRPLDDVSYITWNLFSPMLDGGSFNHFEEVWRYQSRGEIVEPNDVTDRVISHMRSANHDRVVAHYQQPHLPFRTDLEPDISGSVWELYQSGKLGHDEIWEAYEDNLRWVLDDVDILLENVDADHVALTADHGNALGERGHYGHFPYTNNDGMKIVPWLDIGPAVDRETRSPGAIKELETDTEHMLENLGYL